MLIQFDYKLYQISGNAQRRRFFHIVHSYSRRQRATDLYFIPDKQLNATKIIYVQLFSYDGFPRTSWSACYYLIVHDAKVRLRFTDCVPDNDGSQPSRHPLALPEASSTKDVVVVAFVNLNWKLFSNGVLPNFIKWKDIGGWLGVTWIYVSQWELARRRFMKRNSSLPTDKIS